MRCCTDLTLHGFLMENGDQPAEVGKTIECQWCGSIMELGKDLHWFWKH
jgi:hypothetical protein